MPGFTNDFTLSLPGSTISSDARRWVLEEGGKLLGYARRIRQPATSGARNTGETGVPTPHTESTSAPTCGFPLVCKPRFGAGSQATFLARDAAELAAHVAATDWPGPRIVQPLVPGTPVSVAVVVGKAGMCPLIPATQTLSNEFRFQYQGGALPLPEALAERAVRLATQAVAPVEGLCGYVGVDLVLGDATDGRGDVAIEINPRLTTSYVGLRALAESNLAESMLAAVRGEAIPPPRWRRGSVGFTAGGAVRRCDVLTPFGVPQGVPPET